MIENESGKPPIKPLLEHYGSPMVPEGTRWRRMRCPFQEKDRNPSASVNTTLQRFRCFACGINEDAYGLVQWKEGGNFPSAVRFLEELLGRSYDGISEQSEKSSGRSRRRVFEESGPVRGQRAIIPSRVRRKPFTGK